MKIGTLRTKSMTVLDSTDENRFFEGYLTVEMKDKQGEITVVDELYKVLPIWVDRGAPITDTHSNRVIGKGINFAKTTVEEGGVSYPAIKITGKIHKNYELDTDIWEKIKSGEYKGLSFGGATKANRVPRVMKDGDVAYALTDLEHYEVAVCKDPAVPLALITDYNTLAKATVPSEPRGDGKEIITCTKFGCYVNKHEGIDEPEYHDESIIKGEDFSNADITPATVTNTVSQSTQTAKPIKTDTKVGVKESEGGVKLNVTPLEGGIADNKFTKATTALSGTGGGVRANIPDGINRQDGGNSNQVTEDIEDLKKGKRCKECGKLESEHGSGSDVDDTLLDKADINKVIGAIMAGAERIKSGFEVTDTDIKLGGQAVPTEKEKLTSSLGTQNKETTVTTSKIEKGNFCPTCGDKITDEMKETYTETSRPHADCISCGQKKRIAERDRKDDEKMEQLTDGIHRGLARRGMKVTRFSAGKKPKTIN